jgi:hypothetical protein
MCFPLGARWSEEGLREYLSGQNPRLDHFSLSASQVDEVIARLRANDRAEAECASGHIVTFVNEGGRGDVFQQLPTPL